MDLWILVVLILVPVLLVLLVRANYRFTQAYSERYGGPTTEERVRSFRANPLKHSRRTWNDPPLFHRLDDPEVENWRRQYVAIIVLLAALFVVQLVVMTAFPLDSSG